ncbi:unnamed protein product [Meganyctiphanes norvegica]|uniref:Uncharacterized protein n=1 Tax=Meganyctiphanes norvegica TaxID=48144 RepID=A0AAV2Q206_MEGNR
MGYTYAILWIFLWIVYSGSNGFQLNRNSGLTIKRSHRSVNSCTRIDVSDSYKKEFSGNEMTLHVQPLEGFEYFKFRMMLKRLHMETFVTPEAVEFTKHDMETGNWHGVHVSYVKKDVTMMADQHTLAVTIEGITRVLDEGYNRVSNGFAGFVLEALGDMVLLYDCSPEEAQERKGRSIAAATGDTNWKLGITVSVMVVLVIIVVGVAGAVSLRAYRNLEHAVETRNQTSTNCLPPPLVLHDMTDGEQKRLSDNIYEEFDESTFNKMRQNMGALQSDSGAGCSNMYPVVPEGTGKAFERPGGDANDGKDLKKTVTLCEPLYLQEPRKNSTAIRHSNHYVDVTSFLHMDNFLMESR